MSEGEILVADNAGAAQRLAREKHSDDEPFVQYVPRERYERIYAWGRSLASIFSEFLIRIAEHTSN